MTDENFNESREIARKETSGVVESYPPVQNVSQGTTQATNASDDSAPTPPIAPEPHLREIQNAFDTPRNQPRNGTPLSSVFAELEALFPSPPVNARLGNDAQDVSVTNESEVHSISSGHPSTGTSGIDDAGLDDDEDEEERGRGRLASGPPIPSFEPWTPGTNASDDSAPTLPFTQEMRIGFDTPCTQPENGTPQSNGVNELSAMLANLFINDTQDAALEESRAQSSIISGSETHSVSSGRPSAGTAGPYNGDDEESNEDSRVSLEVPFSPAFPSPGDRYPSDEDGGTPAIGTKEDPPKESPGDDGKIAAAPRRPPQVHHSSPAERGSENIELFPDSPSSHSRRPAAASAFNEEPPTNGNEAVLQGQQPQPSLSPPRDSAPLFDGSEPYDASNAGVAASFATGGSDDVPLMAGTFASVENAGANNCVFFCTCGACGRLPSDGQSNQNDPDVPSEQPATRQEGDGGLLPSVEHKSDDTSVDGAVEDSNEPRDSVNGASAASGNGVGASLEVFSPATGTNEVDPTLSPSDGDGGTPATGSGTTEVDPPTVANASVSDEACLADGVPVDALGSSGSTASKEIIDLTHLSDDEDNPGIPRIVRCDVGVQTDPIPFGISASAASEGADVSGLDFEEHDLAGVAEQVRDAASFGSSDVSSVDSPGAIFEARSSRLRPVFADDETAEEDNASVAEEDSTYVGSEVSSDGGTVSHPYVGRRVARFFGDDLHFGTITVFFPREEGTDLPLWHVLYPHDHDSEDMYEGAVIQAMALYDLGLPRNF